MSMSERGYLTKSMANSGNKLNLKDTVGFKVDKHSSGGIGDKTTFILIPLVACLN